MPKPSGREVLAVIDILARTYPTLPLKEFTAKHPFVTLVTTILTQRARDSTALSVAKRLFREVEATPMAFLRLGQEKLEQLISQAGFFRQKARNILVTCAMLVNEHNGHVPGRLDLLLRLPGVGRKTANIVLEHCFDVPTIAVDTHVHRITNRLGWAATKAPEETEHILMQIVPKKRWRMVNHVFVRHGQTLCRPIRPRCAVCPILPFCDYGTMETAGRTVQTIVLKRP